MDWNIASRQSRIPEADLPELHQKAIDLLDLLQKNLPDKTGEKGKWNFEKAHSILHKVREIVLWGNSDNCSCQAPEVCNGVYCNIPVCIPILCNLRVLTARPYREYQDSGQPDQ
jgi:hypothetical protein